jgi:hypothetical protein
MFCGLNHRLPRVIAILAALGGAASLASAADGHWGRADDRARASDRGRVVVRDRDRDRGRDGLRFSLSLGPVFVAPVCAPPLPVRVVIAAPVCAPVVAAAPVCAPVVVRAADPLPCGLGFLAVQTGDSVVVTAYGTNNACGFATTLALGDLDAFGPTLRLSNAAPACVRVASPATFRVSTAFHAARGLRAVRVRLADSWYDVPVTQAACR